MHLLLDAALLLSAGACCSASLQLVRGTGARSYRSISPVRMALSSKPAASRCCCRSMGQTDGRTDARPFRRSCSAYYVCSRGRPVSVKHGTRCAIDKVGGRQSIVRPWQVSDNERSPPFATRRVASRGPSAKLKLLETKMPQSEGAKQQHVCHHRAPLLARRVYMLFADASRTEQDEVLF